MKFSIDGENFETLDKKLYLYTKDINSDKSIAMVAQSISPTMVSNSNRTNITIQMNIPSSVNLPTSNLFIRFKDQFIEESVVGIIQNGRINCEVPYFGRYNVDYPRSVTIDASLDGNEFFGVSQKIQLNGFKKVNTFPSLFTSGSAIKISLSKFPLLNLKSNERMKMKLVSGIVIELNCASNATICETSFSAPTGEYSIQFFINDGLNDFRFYIPVFNEKISIVAKPTLILPTNKILREMKNMFYMTGSGFSLMKNSIKIRGIFDGNTIYASSINVLSDKIGFLFPSIKRSFKRSFNNILEISFNGVNYERISSNIQLIDSFTFDRIAESGGQLSVTFSFQNTSLNLFGTNLNSSSSAIIKLENELFSYTTTSNNHDSNRIAVIIPEFKYYSSSLFTFTFPISATIGISLNDGIDFQTKLISISDKFANLFLIGISPTVGDRRTRNITMQGANLEV
jgi:hypothetical protein